MVLLKIEDSANNHIQRRKIKGQKTFHYYNRNFEEGKEGKQFFSGIEKESNSTEESQEWREEVDDRMI